MVRLTFVGDLFPANLPYNRNCGVASLNFDELHRPNYVRLLRRIVDNNSLFIGNLEAPILFETEFSKEMQFAGHPDFLRMLKDAGINLLSLANNHILEHQLSGLRSTERMLQQENISYIGTIDEKGNSKVEVIEKNGLRIAFVAYNAIDNQKCERGAICTYDFKIIKDDILKLKHQEIDYLIIMLHWGDEYIHRPSPTQIEHARAFIDLGADFVVCSHPHVVQPVEEYHGGLICYSLGNFVFDMTIPKSAKTGMVVYLDLSKKGFIHHERFVQLQENFFPAIIEDDQEVRQLLDTQKLMMNQWQSCEYVKAYDKEKKNKRLKKRVAEKFLLFKNWGKYTPAIRQEFIHYYVDIFKHGKS